MGAHDQKPWPSIAFAVIFAGLFSCSRGLKIDAPEVISVDIGRSSSWALSNDAGNVTLDRLVLPSYILTHLIRAGVVGDPYYRYGQYDMAWVANDSWTYRSTFQAPDAWFKYTNLELVMNGVDTFADVTLNSQPAVMLRNAAKEHRINLRPLLNRGNNTIEIRFKPAVQYAYDEKAAYDSSHPVSVPFLQDKGMLAPYNYVRKRPSDFGWNWAPAFTAQGISGNITIQAYSTPFLRHTVVRQNHTQQSISVIITTTLQVPGPRATISNAESATAVMTVDIPALNISTPALVDVNYSATQQHVDVRFEVDKKDVQLWWPIPVGTPKLYDMKVSFKPEGSTKSSSISTRIGFRDIQLGLDPVPFNGSRNEGESFYFIVNGVPIYTKGTNVVPHHVLPEDVTDADVEDLVTSMSAAHMNMVRVWGGGGFQPDLFYDLCDQQGIMIMQDMMFAASPYPTNEDYLENVRSEVEYNVRRLGAHPSIALWVGNSEVQASLYWGWFWGIRERTQMFQGDYEKMFLTTVGGVVSSIDPERPYWDSSPSKGFWDEARTMKRWFDVVDTRWGTNHYWNFVGQNTDCEDMSLYPKLKYIGEWGFTSSNSLSVLKQVTKSEDWTPYSDMMAGFRNRQVDGENYMAGQMAFHFKVPDQFNSSNNHLEVNTRLYNSWIYFNQVQQAQVLAAGMQRWRSFMADPEACTMGVLYWSINGIWQTSNDWSTKDWNGNWKVAHHMVKRMFEPVTLHTVNANDTFQVLVVNDLLVPVTVLIQRELLGWYDGGCPANRTSYVLPPVALEVPPVSIVEVSSETLQNRLPRNWWKAAADLDEWSTFMRLTLMYDSKVLSAAPQPTNKTSLPACRRQDVAKPLPVGTLKASDLDVKLVTYWQPTMFKDLHLKDPNVTVSQVKQVDPKTVSFMLSSEFPAAWVVLNTVKRGQFSDNGFILYPCYPVKITFTAGYGQKIDVDELMDSLRVTSLHEHQEQLAGDVAALGATPANFTDVKYNVTDGHVTATLVRDPASIDAATLLHLLTNSPTINSALDNVAQPVRIAALLQSPTKLAKTLAGLPPKYGKKLNAKSSLNLTTTFDVTQLLNDIEEVFMQTFPSPSPPPAHLPPAAAPPPKTQPSTPPTAVLSPPPAVPTPEPTPTHDPTPTPTPTPTPDPTPTPTPDAGSNPQVSIIPTDDSSGLPRTGGVFRGPSTSSSIMFTPEANKQGTPEVVNPTSTISNNANTYSCGWRLVASQVLAAVAAWVLMW